MCHLTFCGSGYQPASRLLVSVAVNNVVKCELHALS